MILSVEKVATLLLVLAAQQGVFAVEAEQQNVKVQGATVPESFKQMKSLRRNFPEIKGTQRTETPEDKAKLMNGRGEPKPLSSFAHKWGVKKTAESKIALEDLHENEISGRKLHGFKNNFVSLDFHDDADCENMIESHAVVLGECFEVLNDDKLKSFTVKAHNKLNTVVELTYNNHGCRGVPNDVLDLMKLFQLNAYDQCNTENGVTLSYFDSFPDVNQLSDGVVYTYSLGLDYETCLERFDWADYYRGFTCIDGDWYSLDYCNGEGSSVLHVHFDKRNCRGSYVYSWDWAGSCYVDEDPNDDTIPESLVSVNCLVPPPPTPAPTATPYSYQITCDPFESTAGAFYPCELELCQGDRIIVHTHDEGASCTGDELFKFYAAVTPDLYSWYDDSNGSTCPSFTFTHEESGCQSYVVDQGCFGESDCSGTTTITVMPALLPTRK